MTRRFDCPECRCPTSGAAFQIDDEANAIHVVAYCPNCERGRRVHTYRTKDTAR